MPPATPAAAPLHSMTGFAEARASHAGVELRVTLKSVNHRFLDLRWQAPPELEAALPELERRLRRRLLRGHVDIRLALGGAGSATAVRLNLDMVEAYLQAYAALSARLTEAAREPGPPAPLAAADLLRLPGVLTSAPEVAPPPAEFVAATFDTALSALVRMRAAEGEALVHDLTQCLDRIDAGRDAVAALRPDLEAAQLDRLRRRMQELLAGAAGLDPVRLAQEAALLAERSDVSEELARIAAHTAQARALLRAGGEAGKRLDFLAQELNREVNTLLSKTAAASAAALATTDGGLRLKADLEKFREQLQNLE
jgi:uncharacterized protein (TIGR00255 family)